MINVLFVHFTNNYKTDGRLLHEGFEVQQYSVLKTLTHICSGRRVESVSNALEGFLLLHVNTFMAFHKNN